MKRSSLIFLSTLAFATSTLAMIPNGFYAGVSAGENQMNADLNASSHAAYVNSPIGNGNNLISNGQTADIKRNSVIGDIYVGYGHQLWQRPFYLAGELFANLSRRDVVSNNSAEWVSQFFTEDTTLSSSSNVKLNQGEFGVDLLPGFLFGKNYNDMLYGRVGVAFNKLVLDTNSLLNVTSLIAGAPVSALSSLDTGDCKSVAGLRVGAGFEKYFGHNLAFHTDYIYTNYGKVSASGETDANSPFGPSVSGGFNSHSTADVVNQTLMFGANYYFLPSGQQAEQLAPVVTGDVPAYFNGFYVGLAAGGIQTAADVTSHDSATYVDFSDELAILKNTFGKTSIKKNGLTTSAYAGYGFERAPYYIGAEAFVDQGCTSCTLSANHTASHSNPLAAGGEDVVLNSQPNIKLNCLEYGVDVLPGFIVAPETLLYGRVGLAFSSLELTHNNTFTSTSSFFNPASTVVTSLNPTEKKDVTALRLGVGLEEYLGSHFAANIDYIYTDYGRINVGGTTDANSIVLVTNGGPHPSVGTVTNGFTSDAKADVSSQAVMIGMKYYFSPKKLNWFAKTNAAPVVQTTTTTTAVQSVSTVAKPKVTKVTTA